MSIQKSEIILSCQTLLPIIHSDDNFSYFLNQEKPQHYFSSLISASDFSRVLSAMQRLALKKQPISCIFHLRQKEKPSMLVLANGKYQNGCLKVILYDLATLDVANLKQITYQKLKNADQALLHQFSLNIT